MSYASACSPRRTIARRMFPRGSLVITPSGRTAKVIDHLDDGKIELEFCGCPRNTAEGPDDVTLSYTLLRKVEE